MGTRADFYERKNDTDEWLGSIAWDGYPTGLEAVCAAKSLAEFHAALNEERKREDWTAPERGWPWPWENSHTTDYAYRWIDGKLEAYCFGRLIDLAKLDDEDDETEGPKAEWFPEYGGRQRGMTMGPRSGIIVIGGSP